MRDSSHLALVPRLHVAAVLLGDGLVLSSDLDQDPVQVLLGLGVHLHVHGAGGHEAALSGHLLQTQQPSETRGRTFSAKTRGER